MNKKETADIRFYAAGCMEFESFAECYEDLTLAQAVYIYEKIRKRNASNGPGIGFELHDPEVPDYSGLHYPLLSNGEIARENIYLIPAYANHPLVQEAVQELEKYLSKRQKGKKSMNNPER